MKNQATPNVPQDTISFLARPLVDVVKNFMAQPGQMEKYRAWYEAQMAAGNPLELDPEFFDDAEA